MEKLTLAIFDLDHTLLAGDCSALWSERMQQLGWVDSAEFRAQHTKLMADYHERGLDMAAYLQLTLAPLAGRPVAEVSVAVEQLLHDSLLPRVYEEGRELIAAHRSAGHELLLISASEEFLVEPLGRALGFTHIYGVPCARNDSRFTGASEGLMTYAEGKVTCVERWLAEQGACAERSYFYSDSHNDLPLLRWASDPRPTNPNPRLTDEALRAGWKCRHLRLHPTALQETAHA